MAGAGKAIFCGANRRTDLKMKTESNAGLHEIFEAKIFWEVLRKLPYNANCFPWTINRKNYGSAVQKFRFDIASGSRSASHRALASTLCFLKPLFDVNANGI